MNKRILVIILSIFLVGCTNVSQIKKISMPQKGVYHKIAWSPDGTKVISIFRSKENFDLRFYLYNFSSKEWILLEEVTDISFAFDWINDESIVFERSEIDNSTSALLQSSLVFYNLKSQIQIQLDWGASINQIKKRPHHDELAIEKELDRNQYGIYLYNTETHKETLIYKPSSVDESVSDITWSPDGENIAFVMTKKNPLQTTPLYFYSVYTLNIKTDERKLLINETSKTLDQISWTTTDGIILREIGSDYNLGIQVFSITTDGEKKYIELYGITPLQVLFSPAGDNILITSLGVPGTNDIFLTSK